MGYNKNWKDNQIDYVSGNPGIITKVDEQVRQKLLVKSETKEKFENPIVQKESIIDKELKETRIKNYLRNTTLMSH